MRLAHRYFAGPPEAPALLLLHGVTRCWGDWEPLLPALTLEWRVIALDHRGHGESDFAASYLAIDYAADAVEFLRGLAQPLVIAGHSLGAVVAAAVAAEAPEWVRGIVLEDPPFHTMGNRIARTAWQAQFIGMRECARRGGTVEELTEALSGIRLPGPDGSFILLGELRDRASLRWSAECLTRLDPEVLTPIIEGQWFDGFDLARTLARVQCPALLLASDPAAGGALTATDADEVVASLPSCQRVDFPGVGHQLHRERPEAVLEALRAFRGQLV